MKKLLIILTLLSLGSCVAHLNKTMESWQGHHYEELLTSWGPPQQVFNDGNGGRIFIYTKQRKFTTPGQSTTTTTGHATQYGKTIWGSATSYTTYNPSQTYAWTAYRMFWINAQGTVYAWKWQGF